MSNITSPDMNKLELFVTTTISTYKPVYDNADWEKMEQVLATQHSSHKSKRTGTFPLTTVLATLLAVAVLGVIIYQLSRKGVSPDIETTVPTPVEVKPEPVAKPPVKSKLDEIVPEKDDSAAESDQFPIKDSALPVSDPEAKTTPTPTTPVVKNSANPPSEKSNKPVTTTSDVNSNKAQNTTTTNDAANSSSGNNTSVTGYKKPPSALTILYNNNRKKKQKKDSVQKIMLPNKTIGSDIKQPENLQMKPVEEPKLKGLNNMYKKNKDSAQ